MPPLPVIASLLGGISIALAIAALGLHVAIPAAFVSTQVPRHVPVLHGLAVLGGIMRILSRRVALAVLHGLLHRTRTDLFAAQL